MTISRQDPGFLEAPKNGAEVSCCSHQHHDGKSSGDSIRAANLGADQSIALSAEHHHGVSHSSFLDKAVTSLDNLGIVASMLCLVHCLALPFIITLVPFLGLQIFEGHEAHLWMGGFVWAFALFGMVPGYLKHQKRQVLAGMVIGLSLVTFAILGAEPLLGEQWELPFIVSGNLILVAVHWWNRGLFKCGHEH